MTAPLRAKRKKGNMIIWALMGLLVVSLTGFGVTSVGSGGAQAIGSVGDRKVTVNEYVRALQAQMREFSQQIGQNLTMEQVQAFGIDRMVLQQVLATAALDGESDLIGLSVGDQRVLAALRDTEAFQNLTGQFDETAYRFALDRANLKPAEYDEILRSESARAMLQIAVGAGVQANDTFPLAMLSFVAETRDFEWAMFGPEHLAEPVRLPDETEIEAHYRANPDAYTAPETRAITYALLTPDMLIGGIEPDEEALKALYESDIARYVQPERRIVDRVVFASEADARAAMDAIMAAEKSFADIVAERGLELSDVDLGDVALTDLAPAAGEAVFSLAEPGLVGPVQSSLGPALFRLNAILEAQNTGFDEVRDELHAEFVADRARRMVDDAINPIDDLLASGATLEEIAAETDMAAGKIDYAIGDTDGIAAHQEFRDAAKAVNEGDFPEIVTLEGGGIFALRLDGVTPPALRPLAEVRETVIADWQAAETRRQLVAIAAATVEQAAGGAGLGELALSPRPEAGIRREAFIEGAPEGLVGKVFGLSEGEAALVEDASGIAIVRLTAITPFDPETPDNKALLTGVAGQYSRQIGEDLYDAFATAVQNRAGISLNQSMINAVHTQLR